MWCIRRTTFRVILGAAGRLCCVIFCVFVFVVEPSAAGRWGSLAGQRREHADIVLHSKRMGGTIFFRTRMPYT